MRFDLILFLVLNSLLVFTNCLDIQVEERFRNFLFVDEDGLDQDFQDDLVKYNYPKLILRCHKSICIIAGQITEGLKQYPRYGPQRFTHMFYKVFSPNIINKWKELYGRLTLTTYKLNFFLYAATYKKYQYYNAEIFKDDHWRSQWNQDEFIIRDSHQLIYDNLQEYSNLPTRLEKIVNPPPLIHDYFIILYSTLSGWGGSRCNFYTRQEQLYSLTLEYNAYDRLFCDVFQFYNLTRFQTFYNFVDVRWVRNFLLRDDLISSFLPDRNAVFYGSPGVTFITLKESPILWNNVFRPFSYYLWGSILVSSALVTLASLAITKIGDHMRLKLINPNLLLYHTVYQSMSTSTERVWIIFVRLFKFIITASYAGMILAGILDPSYPWSPKSFKELNESTNFIAATFQESSVDKGYLESSYTLNGITSWKDKEQRIPGLYISEDEQDEEHRYAILMYDDKKDLHIYGRSQLYVTANYTHKFETDKEIVLREMRYVSVPPAATKMHFIIDAIRRLFETGAWMRWKYLEKNYVDYVSPNTILNYNIHWYDKQTHLRSLNLLDILTTIYIWATGMAVSGVVLFVEFQAAGICILKLLTRGLLARVLAFVILILMKMFLCMSYKLQGCRSWLLNLNRIDVTVN